MGEVRETNTGESSGAARGRSSEVCRERAATFQLSLPTLPGSDTANLSQKKKKRKTSRVFRGENATPPLPPQAAAAATGTKKKSERALLDRSLILSFTAEFITKRCKEPRAHVAVAECVSFREVGGGGGEGGGLQLWEAGHP